MHLLRALIVILLPLVCLNVFADEAKPSDESIKQLLTITEAGKSVDKIADDLVASVQNSIKTLVPQVLGNNVINEEQQKILDGMQVKLIELIREEYTWSKLEPVYINIYKSSFTQKEVDGMLAFYKTPAGQAAIIKMPVVAQATLSAIESRAVPVSQQIKKIEEEAFAEAKEVKN